MTGAAAGRPCGASWGRRAGFRKGAAHVCTAGPALSGCQDRRFAHRAAWHAAEQALAAPFHAGGQLGSRRVCCEMYPLRPGCSDSDAAMGPSAVASLSLAGKGRAAGHRAMLPGCVPLMSPCSSSAASARVSSLAHKPLEALKRSKK